MQITTGNVTVVIHRPVLTASERTKREEQIKTVAAQIARAKN